MAGREVAAGLADQVHRTYERLLKVLDSTEEAHLFERLAPTAPSVAFHVWHAARLADRFGARVPTLLPELERRLGTRHERWVADEVATSWGLDPTALGEEQNAMGLADDDAGRIALPDRAAIRGYAVSAFAAAEEVLDAVDDEMVGRTVVGLQGREEVFATTISGQLQHAARHLGMIEALRGVQGERGTATS